MLKKNTRKRLLAGALATVMMLTMCPSWALADDEDIAAPLPLVDENRPVAESAPVETDTTETPAVPTPSEPEAKPAEGQDPAPAPSDDGANGGTDSTGAGNNNASSDASEDNSQNNSAADSTPDVNNQPQDAADINDTSMASQDAVPYGWNDVQTIDAEMWITNRHAADENDNYTITINSQTPNIDNGVPVTDIAPDEFTAHVDSEKYTVVFWQARVQHVGQHQTPLLNDDKTQVGTEIESVRYYDNKLQYWEKGGTWNDFSRTDHLVFYYLIRTGYSYKVQVDVSDWTVTEEPSNILYPRRRGVNYQVIVADGAEKDTVLDNNTFWYHRPLTVSSVRVRQTEAANYTIEDVVLEPGNLGEVNKTNNEFQFSLDLRETKRIATVKIYVSAKKYNLSYDAGEGAITSAVDTYTVGEVYPDTKIIVPTAERKDYTFGGWYDKTTGKPYVTGDLMPGNDLKLTAKWTANTPTPPETPAADAMYFVLLPNLGVPKNGESQGKTNYLPNETSDGGVIGAIRATGYPDGHLTKAGKEAADKGEFNANGVNPNYLLPPSDLGFFTKDNWSPDGKKYIKEGYTSDPFSVLDKSFNVNNIRVVWYTVKYDSSDGYHVDGYVTGVPVKVTYHSNDSAISGAPETTYVVDATSGDTHIVRDNKFTAPNGYEFGGWYTDAACTKGNEVAVGFDKLLMDSWNLYAKWNPKEYHVTYKVDDKDYGNTETYVFKSDVVVRDVPTKEGHTFHGWTPAADVANIIRIDDNGHFIMPAQDVLFNGTFTINQYNVIYKVGTEVVGTDVYNFNSDVVIRPVPTKEGYTFTGWKIGTADAENFKMPAHDVTIEGTFAINRYTVTYKVDTEVVGTDVYDFNSDVVIRDVPTKEGYTFSGWKIGTADAENFKMPAHDVIIEGTFAKNSSGHHHRRPTVTIPDKVPTGLNGNDHYAYIVGYPDKTVRPQNGITRAEVATIFFRLLTDETRNANSTKSNSYSDVAAGAWYNHAVSTLSAMGIVKGDSNGKFNPNAPITRAEFAAIAARFDDKANSTTADFSDIVSHWAKNEISAASNNGWINGYPDGTFRPDNKITRAEAMTLVNRVLKRLPETAEDLHDDMIKWSDNSDASQWFYLAVQEATNSHYYKAKENKFEKWSELRDTRDWTELEK